MKRLWATLFLGGILVFGAGTYVLASEEPTPAPMPDDKDKPGEPKLLTLSADEPAPQPDDKDKPEEPKLG
jgi:hypothetical protein